MKVCVTYLKTLKNIMNEWPTMYVILSQNNVVQAPAIVIHPVKVSDGEDVWGGVSWTITSIKDRKVEWTSRRFSPLQGVLPIFFSLIAQLNTAKNTIPCIRNWLTVIDFERSPGFLNSHGSNNANEAPTKERTVFFQYSPSRPYLM